MNGEAIGEMNASIVVGTPKPSYNFCFFSDCKEIGRLDFSGPSMVFTGDADASAKQFFDYVAGYFRQRLQEEREAAIRTQATSES